MRDLAIVADGFGGAGVEGFFGESDFCEAFGLVVDVGEAFAVVTNEKLGCDFAALIAIDTGVVVIIFTGCVEWILVGVVGHGHDIRVRFEL